MSRVPYTILVFVSTCSLLAVRERSHITSSLRWGGGRWMMKSVIFLMGNNSNIDDERGGGRIKKAIFMMT